MEHKRRKLDASSSSSNKYELLKSWHLKPILGDDVTCQHLTLVEVYVDEVTDRRQISRLIKDLNSKLPLPELQHLKKVKGNAMIIALASQDSPEICMSILKEKGLDVTGLTCKPKKVSVPASPPKTRRHFEEASTLWPCNFHPDKYLEKVLGGKLFGEEDLLEIQDMMLKSLDLARYSISVGGAGVGAVVVDPLKKTVIAAGYDDIGHHPLQHAVMVAVDLVARSQGGGAPWNLRDRQWFLCHDPKSSSDDSNIRTCSDENSIIHDGKEVDPIIYNLPAKDSSEHVRLAQVSESCNIPTENYTIAEHSADTTKDCNRTQPRSTSHKDLIDMFTRSKYAASFECSVKSSESFPKSEPYLCTGYDVFVTREPCAMCAMALVHSRVRRVFYGCASPRGALSSISKLHTLKALNHHYEVFAGVLQDECAQVQNVSLRD